MNPNKEIKIEKAIAELKKNKITFSVNNGGIHLIIYNEDMVIDFWPTKDKWQIRGSGIFKYGLNTLLERCSIVGCPSDFVEPPKSSLIDELKDLATKWKIKADPFRESAESLTYLWCADDLNKIIEKHENPEDAE